MDLHDDYVKYCMPPEDEATTDAEDIESDDEEDEDEGDEVDEPESDDEISEK
jgi:hypothetical protein